MPLYNVKRHVRKLKGGGIVVVRSHDATRQVSKKLDKKVAENFRKIRLATKARERAHQIQAVRNKVLFGR